MTTTAKLPIASESWLKRAIEDAGHRPDADPMEEYLEKITDMGPFWLDSIAGGDEAVLAAESDERKAKLLIGLKALDNTDVSGDEGFMFGFFMGRQLGASIAAASTLVDPRPGIIEAVECCRSMLEDNRKGRPKPKRSAA